MRTLCIAAGIAVLSLGCSGAATEVANYLDDDQSTDSDSQNRVMVSAALDESAVGAIEIPETTVDVRNNKPRQVIHRTSLSLTVTEFGNIDDQVADLTAKHGGYITTATVRRTEGVARTGHWDVRVPVENYRIYMADICALGVPISRNETAEDVNDQYVDLAARLKNEQAIEERVRELLKQSAPTSQQISDFDKRLEKARKTIEQLQGQLNVLANKAAYAFVTIDAREELEFVPGAAPSETDRISVAWTRATSNLKSICTGLIVWLIAALPWMIVTTPVLVIGWFALRLVSRRIFIRREQAVSLQ